MNRSMMFSAVK